jgi:hypothetical protein
LGATSDAVPACDVSVAAFSVHFRVVCVTHRNIDLANGLPGGEATEAAASRKYPQHYLPDCLAAAAHSRIYSPSAPTAAKKPRISVQTHIHIQRICWTQGLFPFDEHGVAKLKSGRVIYGSGGVVVV